MNSRNVRIGGRRPLPRAVTQSRRKLTVPRILPETRDREFLPAALAIVETPASPIKIGLMLTICAFTVGALAWACLGEIDVIATAKGKVEVTGHSKVIQPLESGRVTELLTANGKLVKAGDVLIRLDPREVEADLEAASATVGAASAEALRRAKAIETVKSAVSAAKSDTDIAIDLAPAVDWPNDLPVPTKLREAEVLSGDLRELQSTLSNLADQEREKQAAVDQLTGSLVAERHLQEIQSERVDVREALMAKMAGSKLDLIDAEQTLRMTAEQITSDTGKETSAKAALASLRSDRRHTIEAFLSDQTRKMADARRTVDEKRADIAKAKARLDHMTLTAPIDGVVQALAVTTQGQVVTSGQEVMHIVPTMADSSSMPIEIEAYVTNDDIGFVTPGQEAVIKIDSFPFTRFGTITGTVLNIASDAIPVEQANTGLADPTRSGDPSSHALTPTAQPMTDLVFETHIRPASNAIQITGKQISLTPGMTVTVEIRTGSRKIIDYLFSPLIEVESTAMRER